MAKKKIYAVKKGKRTGIFYSWDACKAAVDGYPGAEYKGFLTETEAEEYLSKSVSGVRKSTPTQTEEGLTNQIVAYVDGSFDVRLGKYSFGCVILMPDGRIIKESGNGNNPESAALRNVTGEMLGAMYAVKWCEVNEYSKVQICYDYYGIEKWATGEWRAKNNLTQKYAAFMKEQQKNMDITFKKIAAHTGEQYNEEADRLAKAALVEGNGIPKVKRL